MSKLEMVDGFWPVGTVVRLLGDASPSMVATSECRIARFHPPGDSLATGPAATAGRKADGRPPVLYTYVANEKREQVFCWLEFTPDQWRKREVWLDPRLTEPV